MLPWTWPIRFNLRKNCEDGGKRRRLGGARVVRRHKRPLRLETLEDRTLMSGDPYLTLVLASHTIAENAGPAATTGTVTRNNMDTSQALVVNLKSSDTTQVTVPANVTIPAGASSANFTVGAVDNLVVDPTRTVTITAWAPSPIAAGLDATFGSGGYLSVPSLVDTVSANFPGVKVQADGKILAVAGSASSGATWAIGRALSNGTLDTSFGTNGTAVTTFPGATSGYANGIAIQPDGKIVVVGTVNISGTFDAWGIARYNTDGTLDSTFGTGGLVTIKFTGEGGWLYDAAILSNGNILVGGMRQEAAGFAVARLTSTGAIDTSFGTNGFAGINPDPAHSFFNTTGQAMIVQPDGKILMTGIANYNGIPVARFNANGTPDTSFNGTGVQLIPFSAFGASYTSGLGQDLTVQADGKIIVTGHVDPASSNDNWATARLNADGTLDTSFNGTGTATISFAGGSDIANDVAVQADGKIIVAGRADVGATLGQGYNLALARYNADGTLDSTFNGNGEIIFPPLPSIFEEIRDIGLQADGKLAAIVGYNTDMRIARFDTGLLVASDSVSVTDTDGSVLIPITNHRDLVYDASRNILYITAANGTVQRYNIASQSLLSALQVGTSLYGADVTADDSSLYVAEGSTNVVHKVNLASGAVTNLTYAVAFGEAGAWDVAISANGKGLVTTQFSGSGWVPLHQLDTSTDTLSVRTDDPGSGFGGEVRQNSLLARSADRSLLSLTESNISDGRAMTYSAASDSFPVFSDTGMFLDNSLAAISRDGSLIAVDGGFAMVADRNFHGVVTLPGIDGGVAFDPTRDLLYGVNSSTDQILAFDTHTWAVKYVLAVGENVSTRSAFGSGVMRVSDDGKLLFLATPSGIRMYNLRLSTGVASSLSVAGFPSFVTAGTSANFTVTALDPAGNVATGYTGTVTFASTDGAATLPNSYTFTASDQGVHTFTATLNTAGTQSLTAADSGNGLTAAEGNIVVHATGASLIPVTTHRDLIFDPQRHILYITTSSGTVERYDLASGNLLTPFQLIEPLNGGDITVSGNALYVVDGLRNLIQGFVDKVDLSAGTTSRLTYDLAGGGYFEDAAWDLKLGPANLGLVTTKFPGSGFTPLRQLDTSTDKLSVRTDDPGSGGGGQVSQNTQIRRGADRSEFILTESNISSGPLFAYNAANNTFSSHAVDTNTFLDNRPSAVNRNGTLLALDIFNTGITIYDPNLNVLKVLTGVHGGLLFDPVRDFLYVASGSSVAVYNTNTWGQTLTLGIGESLGTLLNFGNGMMAISNDGQFLFVTTPSGVRIVNVPASVTSFSISGLPASTQAGTGQSFTLTALDNLGHVATNYTVTVHFTSTDSQAALPADYTFTAMDAGQHGFSVTLKTAGSQRITATDTVNPGVTGSNSILVNAAAATHFAVSASASATAGSAFTFTLTAQDPFANAATGYTGTVHFTSTDAQAVLPANSTLTNGTGSFSATLKTAGSQTITATDTSTATITGSQVGITVNPAAASSLVVAGFPSPTTAGVTASFTVTAMDPYSNTATGYVGTIHITSSDGQAVLPADYTFMAADAGQHSFSATLKTAGSQSLTATDTVNNSLTGSQTGITVNPAAASSFVVSGYPSPITAGTANSFKVTAKDPYGNTATGYARTVKFTTSSLKAILPGNYLFTGSDSGVHMFSATLRSAGSQSITATDTVNGSITGTQSGITVNPGAPHHLAIARFPYKPTAGVAGSFRVTIQDIYSNTINMGPYYPFTDTVKFTSTDPKAMLPANYTFMAPNPGYQDFMATLYTAGTQGITVQDVTNPSIISAFQSNILLQPAAASQLQVAGFPTSVIAGTAHNFTVTAMDPYGNIATGYTSMVHFTSSTDMQANLPADYTFTGGDAGVHTMFSATFNTAGNNQSITATDTVNAGITGTETGISVVSMQPTASVSGPTIGVPGQPLTFTFDASESSPSAGPPYTYSINWGDGSPLQSLSSSNSSSVAMTSHIFTMPGSFTVSVTATDPDGNTSLPASAPPVSITTLAMEPDPSNSSQTALYVGGTTGNDNIAITPAVMMVNGNPVYGVKVGMNLVSYGSFFSIGHVVVYSQGGSDIIKTAAQTINGTLTYVTIPVMFFAGNGNDVLNVTGSSAGNVLVGGGGMDRLIGGQGRDILIGGAGPATLQAGSNPIPDKGGAILIGGTTDYDNNVTALAAFLTEWTSTDDYATRIASLSNSLHADMPGMPATVHDNHMADNLYGGTGMDWFFRGMMDVINNQTAGEMVTPIM
jgi:uncharacterized delta-60 repeat protein